MTAGYYEEHLAKRQTEVNKEVVQIFQALQTKLKPNEYCMWHGFPLEMFDCCLTNSKYKTSTALLYSVDETVNSIVEHFNVLNDFINNDAGVAPQDKILSTQQTN